MKAYWKSFTLWFNSAAASLALVLPELMVQLPVMKEYVPTDMYRWLFIVTVLGNVMLRFKTTTAVGVRDA